MVLTKNFAAGIGVGLMVAACAGVQFPYKYYGVDLVDQKLLGPTAVDDLSLLTECSATATDASPCSAMLTSQMLALKQDYISTKEQLISCQQQLAAK